ncbi:MAG: ribulose-phosphate 3-epimerase [Lachnospiraceae bacterium]
MEYVLSPSILAADFQVLGEQIRQTEECGAKYLHFDVMDGIFVPSISFGMPVLQSIHDATEQVMDVHLMITEPIRYIKEFAEAGADIITIHLEACKDVRATLEAIRSCGKKAGLSICPETPVSAVKEFMDFVDMVLIMSVHPGFGGQKFIEESLEKIRELRKVSEEAGLDLNIEVDGGIYKENIEKVLDAGANVIVAGSAVFRGNVEENTEQFVEILRNYEMKG